MKTHLLILFLGLGVSSALADPVSPAPTATPGAEASPTPFHRYEDTGVYHVRNESHPTTNQDNSPCQARRNDVICIYVKHLKSWLNDPQLKDRLPKDARIGDLVPFLDDVPLPGIHPEQSWPAPPDTDSELSPQTHYLRFTLRRTETSKDAWTRILNRPHFTRLMKVSVGFENGEEMPTWVLPTAKRSENQLIFTLIPPVRFWLGVVLIVGAFVVFVYLAYRTDIIRDTSAPRRPDKRRPYSLARAQMAFWFFLVLGAFFFLWVIVGDTDTLNSSVLALIGISASTALAAAFIDSGDRPAPAIDPNLAGVDFSNSHEEVAKKLNELIEKTDGELKRLEEERPDIDSKAKAELAANAEAQAAQATKKTALKHQLTYFEWPAWRGVMYDLLAEKETVSFHRFQIFVWTIVLGIMFVANVYNELAMPQFSATLLGLLGISAGTYVGFKIPDDGQSGKVKGST